MAEQENPTTSYRKIFKATSLFGGVQVYQILIGIIRSKFVAVLLGPAGMGIQGLYQSAIQMVQSFSSLGLSSSAVRDVSEANGSGDAHRIGLTVAVVKRLVWITGLIGLVATAALSPVLSKTTFGNYDYVIPFIFLSVTLLIDQLSAGQRVILQGTRKLRFLARSTAIGSTVGLAVSIPLYYWFGVRGIVPTLMLNSVTMLCLTWYFSRKVKVEKVKVTNKETFQKGKSMLRMGIAMSISAIMVTLTSYLLRGYIRHMGGSEQVGLFTAGFVIINTYVGMVFNAMGTDYYPRLAAVNKDNDKCRRVINQQGEIATLIIAPLLVSCMILMPFIIRIIYTDKFLPAADYVLWAVVGMMFKVFSWVISFCFLAKAESKLFIINETVTNVYSLIFSILGYYLYGLTGLGIAFTLSFFLYSVQVFVIAKIKYGFAVDYSFRRIFVFLFVIVCATFVLIHTWKSVWVYVPATVLFIICSIYSLKELNKRMDVWGFIRRRLR